jgi:serine/threonine protein kinase
MVFLGLSPGGRQVAVKLIPPGYADTRFRERFAREIEAARRVGGFHTAPVIDADPAADSPWVVTAYIHGPSLQDAVETGGPFGLERVCALGAGLAEGLAEIHEVGLVHRDLKPSNVILAENGPRIIDFGIARAAAASLTTTGDFAVGTYGYASPEQVQGERAGPASDVFALGGTLVFAAAGRAPFGDEPVAAVVYRIVAAPPDLAGVPDERGFRQLISQCLAKSPDDRPTLAAIMARLREIGTPAGPVSEEPATGYQAVWAPESYASAAEPEPSAAGNTPDTGELHSGAAPDPSSRGLPSSRSDARPAPQPAPDTYLAPYPAAPPATSPGPAPPPPPGPSWGSAEGSPPPVPSAPVPRGSRPRLRLPRGGLPRLRLPRRGRRPRLSGEAEPAQDRGEWMYSGYGTRPAGESRYANATISDARSGQPWSLSRAIQPEDLLLLRVDIGAPSSLSQVQDPVPFPDRQLPAGDLVIDVVVTSTTFTVGPFTEGADRLRVPAGHAHASHFVLPGDGGPARAADGGSGLTFALGAPRSLGPARLRIIYYFRGAIVQAQLLAAVIAQPVPAGGQTPAWSLVTDYTISRYLPGVVDISRRPRLSVVLNGDGAGHEIYVRMPGPADGQRPTAAVSLPPAIAGAVRDLRRALAGEPVAPATVTQSRAQLITAMRTIAPLGWQLCAALFPGLQEVLYSLQAGPAPALLHVARPAGVTLSVPWALLYTTSLDSRHGPGFQSVPLCPLLSNWDGRAPLVSSGQTFCPHAGSISHTADLLCPFGFLGFRHDIEQLNSADRPVVTITAPSGSRVVIAKTAYQIDRKALQHHVTGLRQAFARLPGVDVEEAASKDQLKQLICADLPVIYFLCHGERPRAGSPETFLGIGNREHLTPADFIGWVQDAFLSQHIRVWDQIRPLIFINACHSAELDPAALFNYIDAFVGMGHAAGVIGTEVKVSQELAMEFARCFFDELLSPGITVGMAMRHARLAFLAKGNLFGLNYTPYCWADLTVAS